VQLNIRKVFLIFCTLCIRMCPKCHPILYSVHYYNRAIVSIGTETGQSCNVFMGRHLRGNVFTLVDSDGHSRVYSFGNRNFAISSSFTELMI
jgi:hypothetical protein